MPFKISKRAAPLCCLLLAALVSHAAPPVMRAYPLSAAPQLDGEVAADPAWAAVEPASGLKQVRPYEGQPATQRTNVYVGFTKEALYIGVICYDDDPQRIIVADSRRDSSLEDTDSFQVILDSFRDKQNGFVFGTNPAGVEYDGQVTKEGTGDFMSGGGGFNLNWDTSWEVRASISESGWSAEMEIPFRSLRYGREDVQTWGVNFQRNIRRNNEIVFWSPLARQHNLYRISDAGTIEGLEVPAQRNLKVTPYVLGQASRGGELPAGTHYEEEFGFDIKYSITPSLTLDFTYNTDFAQVEVDEQQINLDRFSLFFPEKRPFFLENAGQFAVGNPEEVELFFSRRIGISSEGEPIPIDAGLRLSGRIGAATNVGLLYMSTEAVPGVAPGNDYAVARLNREFANRSSLGALFVDRSGDASDDYNRTYAIDGRWGIGEHIDFEAWAARTETPGFSGKDDAFAIDAGYNSEKWVASLAYTEVGGDFNPEVGFLARSDYRKAEGLILRRIRPDDLWGLHELRPHVSYRGYWDFDGFHETGRLHVDNHFEWKSGWEIHTGVNFTLEGVKDPFEIADGATVQPGTYEHQEFQLVFRTNEGAPLSFGLRAQIGGFFGGEKTTLRPSVRYRIGETFSTELSWNYNDIRLPVSNGDFEVNLGRFRISYSFTPKILLQALVQYDDRADVTATNLRFSWLQSANAGLFLVYNEVDERGIGAPPDKGREFIIKYSRIFDLLN
ncbi:MAG: DUF5916 domain-containing protein [Woeseiaceae bacterium]